MSFSKISSILLKKYLVFLGNVSVHYGVELKPPKSNLCPYLELPLKLPGWERNLAHEHLFQHSLPTRNCIFVALRLCKPAL